jgi:DNA-binding Lrp family transcriptional regulator
MQAIVHIHTDPGKALKILDAVKKVEGVRVAFATTGRFDIIARVEAADLRAMGEAVVGKIQAIAGVRSTETSMIVA